MKKLALDLGHEKIYVDDIVHFRVYGDDQAYSYDEHRLGIVTMDNGCFGVRELIPFEKRKEFESPHFYRMDQLKHTCTMVIMSKDEMLDLLTKKGY